MIPVFKNTIKDEQFIEIFNKAKESGEIQNVFNKSITESYERLDNASKKYFTKSEYEDFLINYVNHILKKENKDLTEFVLEKFRKLDIKLDFRINWINLLNSYVGVFCLTEIYNMELMWVNYSENHTGIVLEFNTDHHFFTPILQVNYDSEIPTLDLSELNEIEKNPFKYLNIIKVKSPTWSYEKEHRIFKLLIHKDRIADKLDPLQFQVYLFKFPPHCLKGIIFGSRCSESSIESFKELIDFNLYRNLSLYKMTMDYDSRSFNKEVLKG